MYKYAEEFIEKAGIFGSSLGNNLHQNNNIWKGIKRCFQRENSKLSQIVQRV